MTVTKVHHNAYMRRWTARRRAILNIYKHAAGCADCGYRAFADALEFDHVRGEKSFTIGRGTPSVECLWQEIEKCDVVCAICHRIRTAKRRCS